MKQEINPKHFQVVITELMATKGAKSAIKYVSESLVVKATWHNAPKANSRGETMVVTFGKPNYAEREFIKQCRKAGEPFPVRKTQFKFYPVKKK